MLRNLGLMEVSEHDFPVTPVIPGIGHLER